MKFRLEARPPFNFHSVVHSHGWYQLAPMHFDAETETLETAERLSGGRVARLRLRGTESGVEVETPGRFAKSERDEVAARVRWMLMLDSDLSRFYALADSEPKLAHCRTKAQGRFLRSASVWEDLVKVMMTTNIQWGGTKRLVGALVNRFGELPEDGSPRRAFPLPERIARSRETTLRSLGLGYRAPYLLALARTVAMGKTDLDAWRDSSHATEKVRRELIALPGIGPYAAAIMLGLLGRYDYIGVDTEAMSLVSKGFYGGKPIGAKEIENAFAHWGEFKLLAYWFWDWEGKQQAPMEAYEMRQ